jgi:hypothetical protein
MYVLVGYVTAANIGSVEIANNTTWQPPTSQHISQQAVVESWTPCVEFNELPLRGKRAGPSRCHRAYTPALALRNS